MADANKVIEKLTGMLGAAQRELAIALVTIEELQEQANVPEEVDEL